METPNLSTPIAPPSIPYDLTGRMADCRECHELQPSDGALAYFEYRGEGSAYVANRCQCGKHAFVHNTETVGRHGNGEPRLTVIELGICGGFVQRAPEETDSFYCGCEGWS